MFESIKKVLSGGSAQGGSGEGIGGRHPNALQIAACVVLLEMAHADDTFTEEERLQISRFFEEGAHLSKDTTEELLLLAEQARQKAIELWEFTRLIAETFSLEEKIGLVETMWKIIYLDGKLDMREDYLIHKLSPLLGLRHSELIEAKLRVLQSKERAASEPPEVSG